MTGAAGLLTVAANVMRPPPVLRIWTVAVATVRLHMSTERTTLVTLTSKIGRLLSCPIGITSNPEDELANKLAPSAELMIFEKTGSGRRRPRSGVRLDARRICSTLCVVVGGTGMPMGPMPTLCGFVLVFNGLIGGCVENVA